MRDISYIEIPLKIIWFCYCLHATFCVCQYEHSMEVNKRGNEIDKNTHSTFSHFNENGTHEMDRYLERHDYASIVWINGHSYCIWIEGGLRFLCSHVIFSSKYKAALLDVGWSCLQGKCHPIDRIFTESIQEVARFKLLFMSSYWTMSIKWKACTLSAATQMTSFDERRKIGLTSHSKLKY